MAYWAGFSSWVHLQSENKLCVRPAQYGPAQACKLTISSYLFARWRLFRHIGYLRNQQQVDLDLLTLKVVSESRVTLC